MKLATAPIVLDELQSIGQVKRAHRHHFMRVDWSGVALNKPDTHFLPHLDENGVPRHRMKRHARVERKRQRQNRRTNNVVLMGALAGAGLLLMWRR